LTHDQVALYTRIYVNICIWDMAKGYDVIYASPPDQLVYDDDIAHNGYNMIQTALYMCIYVCIQTALYTRIYVCIYIYVYGIWKRLWRYIRTTT